MIVAGGSVYRGTKTLMGRQPRVAFSKDGREWTAPRRVLSEGEWLWRVTWHDGKAYGVSYTAPGLACPEDAATGKPPASADWKLKLFAGDDGVNYDLVTHLDVPGHPNETTLRFLPDGEMVALVRREAGNTSAGSAAAGRPTRSGGGTRPSTASAGRTSSACPTARSGPPAAAYTPGAPKTVVARMTRDDYEPVLTLPSGGDTSYPGLVWHEGLLWMSYYSSHEGKSAIYLAKIKLPLEAED